MSSAEIQSRSLSVTCFLLCFCVFHLSRAISPFLQHEVSDTGQFGADVIFLEKSHLHNRRSREISSNLEAVIKIHGDNLYLRLQRATAFDSHVSLFTSENGRLQQSAEILTKDYGLYQDFENGASVIAHWTESRDDREYPETWGFLEGCFVYKESVYCISPSSPVTGSAVYAHTVVQIKGHINFESDIVRNESVLQKKTATPPHSVQKRQVTSPVTYEVELMLITDYSMYKFWMEQTGNETEAEELLRRYCAYLINSVDLRYQNIRESDMAFRVKLSGLYITKTLEESGWTEDYKITAGNGQPIIDGEKALASLNDWLTQANQSWLEDFDHVMLLTRYPWLTGSGLAGTGQICTPTSTSLVKNNFNFLGVVTSTHELGHSLGAGHDDDKKNCSGADGYIMAAHFHTRDSAVGVNHWYFSSCTLHDFRVKMADLNSRGNCLLVTNTPNLPLTPPDILFGQLYDLDTQCQMTFGEDFYFCRILYPDPHLCSSMKCCKFYFPDYGTSPMVAGRGSTCGNKTWCIDGECTSDPSAPSVDDLCPFGDHPGILQDGLTCSGMLTAITPLSECYAEDFRRICCESCAALSTGLSGCEFGDTNNGCTRSSFQRHECYTKNDTCCATCDRLRDDSAPDCQFGDYPECRADTIHPCHCLQEETSRTCCETCRNLTIPEPEDCVCFDRKDCSFLHEENYQCYIESFREECCKTCLDIKNNVTLITQGSCEECEYGNKLSESSCMPLSGDKGLCYNTDNNRKCCLTCCSLRNDSLIGCEFGNKNSFCDRPGFHKRECYLNEDNCCETCLSVKNPTIPGCEFGNKNSSCERPGFHKRECYIKEDVCCETCLSLKNSTIPGCKYGDKSSQCGKLDFHKRECYLMEDFCCETCLSLKNSTIPGCEFGNKFSECERPDFHKRECYLNEDKCCETCLSLKNSTIPGCPYGNLCSITLDRDCYGMDQFTLTHQCCEACSQRIDCFKPGCEFGDRATGCTINHCALNPTQCCGTCWNGQQTPSNFSTPDILAACVALGLTTDSPTTVTSEPTTTSEPLRTITTTFRSTSEPPLDTTTMPNLTTTALKPETTNEPITTTTRSTNTKQSTVILNSPTSKTTMINPLLSSQTPTTDTSVTETTPSEQAITSGSKPTNTILTSEIPTVSPIGISSKTTTLTRKPTTIIPETTTVTRKPSTISQETTTAAPKPTTIIPETTTVTRKPSTISQETTTVTPKPTTIIPETTNVTPKPTTIIPETTTTTRKPTTIIPETTTVTHKPTTIIPETTTVARKPTTSTATTTNTRATSEPSTYNIYTTTPKLTTPQIQTTPVKHTSRNTHTTNDTPNDVPPLTTTTSTPSTTTSRQTMSSSTTSSSPGNSTPTDMSKSTTDFITTNKPTVAASSRTTSSHLYKTTDSAAGPSSSNQKSTTRQSRPVDNTLTTGHATTVATKGFTGDTQTRTEAPSMSTRRSNPPITSTARPRTTSPVLGGWEPLLSVRKLSARRLVIANTTKWFPVVTNLATMIGVALGGVCVLLVVLVVAGVCLCTKSGKFADGNDWIFAPFKWGTSSSKKSLYQTGDNPSSTQEDREYPSSRNRPWHESVYS